MKKAAVRCKHLVSEKNTRFAQFNEQVYVGPTTRMVKALRQEKKAEPVEIKEE